LIELLIKNQSSQSKNLLVGMSAKHAEKVAAGAGPQAEQALDNLVKDAKPPSRP
jgi:hypothetical protein